MYVWIFAYFSGWHPRLVLATAVATLWGLRLTYNFARKKGYTACDPPAAAQLLPAPPAPTPPLPPPLLPTTAA